MEHRQGPEIDRVASDVGGEDVAGGEQIGAAMVVDDALRIASRTRSIVERDRVPFVAGRRSLVGFVPLGDQGLVVEIPQPLARPVVFAIVVVDDQRADLGALERPADDPGEFAVDHDHLGLPVIQHESDRGRVEARVEGVEDGAAHRDTVVAFEHRGRVGEHDRYGVAANEASLGERGGEFLRSRVELAIAAAQRSVSNRQPIREHRSGAL